LIATSAVILFLGTWALIVLSSDAETSTFLWGLPRLDQSPAREVAAAVVGGVIVGLVLVPLQYWIDRQSDSRREVDDKLAARMVVCVVRAFAAAAAEEEIRDTQELSADHIASEFREIALPFSYGRFYNVLKYWAARSSVDERWGDWGHESFLKHDNEDTEVIQGTKFSFPAQLARVRAGAVMQMPSGAGALLAHITDEKKIEKMTAAFEMAVPVLTHIEDHHTSFTTVYVERAVDEVEGKAVDQSDLGSQYARYQLVFEFLSAYRDMELVLLGTPAAQHGGPPPYPLRLSYESNDPLDW